MQKHHIICVGCNSYLDNKIQSLSFCTSDAYEIAQAWSRYNNINIDINNIFIGGVFKQPTRSNILSCLDNLAYSDNIIDNEDIVWFFYSGHGAVINNLHYLILTDTMMSINTKSFELLEKTSITTNEIIQFIRKTKAKYIILFLDCCVDIIPDSERRITNAIDQQHVLEIRMFWSQTAKEIWPIKHGALSKSLLDVINKKEFFERKENVKLIKCIELLQKNYLKIKNKFPSLSLSNITTIWDKNQWNHIMLETKKDFDIIDELKKERINFTFQFPQEKINGKLVDKAWGYWSGEKQHQYYYIVLEDFQPYLYCQYPEMRFENDKEWIADNISIGNDICKMHICGVNEETRINLEELRQQNKLGRIPIDISNYLLDNIIKTIELESYN